MVNSCAPEVFANEYFTTKDRTTRSPQTIGSELGCSGRVGSFYSTCGASRDRSCMWKGLDCDYDKWIISVTGHLWHKYSVTFNQTATLCHDMNHTLCDIGSTERYILHVQACWNVATHKCEVPNGNIEIIWVVRVWNIGTVTVSW